MSARRRTARVDALVARRAAAQPAGLDEDIFSLMPPWWRALTDDELAEIAQMQFDSANRLVRDCDRRRYREIEQACRARAKSGS